MLLLLLGLLASAFLADTAADILNLRRTGLAVPPEFQSFYDSEKYEKSQGYLKDKTRFQIFQRTLFTGGTILFILLGGFSKVDDLARSFALGPIETGLIFAFLLSAIRTVLQIPFSLYETFVIEEKFGFNRSTFKLFVVDGIKGTLLGTLLGAVLLAGLFWFFGRTGSSVWIYAWIAFTLFQLILIFLAPVLIMPLFNRFEPLPDSELKTAIESFAKTQNFILSGIYLNDASKRSSKTNAYFTGFGRFRRLVLFDTLIKKHSTEELVAVVAHEIGHFKRSHIQKSLALSVLTTGALFWCLSLLMENESLFRAFKMQHVSVYASVIFVSLFFSPVLRFLSPLTQALSRRFEYEADEYSLEHYPKPEVMITALKRLSAENLSNLFPHPFMVFMNYTHPPVLKRIEAIRRISPTGH